MNFKGSIDEFIAYMRSLMDPETLAQKDREIQIEQRKANEAHARGMAALKRQWAAYESGEDWRTAMAERLEADLERIRISSSNGTLYTHISCMPIIPQQSECTACTSLSGALFSIEEALQNSPLPPPGCTCQPYPEREKGFCLCLFDPVFDDEIP